MNEKIIFLIFVILLLGILLWQVGRKNNFTHKLLFFFTLIILSAVYLFQFGELGSFIFSSKWADVQFIKEKKKEVRQDAKEISQIRNQIQKILEDSRHIQGKIVETQEKILSLEKDLVRTANIAEPPILSYYSKEITKIEGGYEALLSFKPSKNRHLGLIKFYVKILDNSNAEIIDFWPEGAFISGKDSKNIAENKKEALLRYSMIGMGYPKVKLTISKPAKVSISGSHKLKEFSINIK